MFTLTISDKQKRRTLGYLTNDYYPGGKKDLGRIVNYKILGDDGEGFFKIGFPGMDRNEFEDVVKKLIQQGVSAKGADSQLTENNIMKLVNLVPLNENRLSGPFNSEQIKKMVSRDPETMFFANGQYYQATSEFQDFKDDLSVMDRDGTEDYIDIKDIEFAEATHGFAGVGMENEGSCGYAPEGEDPNKADQPAGSHLLRKKIREIIESFADDPDVPGTTGMEDAGGKIRDNIAAVIPDNYSYKDLAQDIAYIIQNDYGSHNAKPFIQMLTQKLQRPNY